MCSFLSLAFDVRKQSKGVPAKRKPILDLGLRAAFSRGLEIHKAAKKQGGHGIGFFLSFKEGVLDFFSTRLALVQGTSTSSIRAWLTGRQRVYRARGTELELL